MKRPIRRVTVRNQQHRTCAMEEKLLMNWGKTRRLPFWVWPIGKIEKEAKRQKKWQDEEEQGQGGGDLFKQIGRDLSKECVALCSRFYYDNLSQISRGFRSLIGSGDIYRLRRHNGIHEDCIYYYFYKNEDATFLAYDPNCNNWTNLPRVTTGRQAFILFSKTLAVGTQFLLFGTDYRHRPCTVVKYSILSHSWSPGVEMNSPRSFFALASLGEKAIVAGGSDLKGNASTCAELYDSEKETWLPLPSMNKPRKCSSAVFMDGKFYIIGGSSSSNSEEEEMLTCAEEYDLESRVWKVIPNMSACHDGGPGRDYPMVAVVRNELYAVDSPQHKVIKFDMKYKSWITLGSLPEACYFLSMSFLACGERLIVTCGSGEIYSWIPHEGPLVWDMIAQKTFPDQDYHCAVMRC